MESISNQNISESDLCDPTPNVEAVNQLMLELKGDCKQMLLGYYYERKSMRELAFGFGLASEQAAKNKKSRCLKHLNQIVSKQKLTPEDFIL